MSDDDLDYGDDISYEKTLKNKISSNEDNESVNKGSDIKSDDNSENNNNNEESEHNENEKENSNNSEYNEEENQNENEEENEEEEDQNEEQEVNEQIDREENKKYENDDEDSSYRKFQINFDKTLQKDFLDLKKDLINKKLEGSNREITNNKQLSIPREVYNINSIELSPILINNNNISHSHETATDKINNAVILSRPVSSTKTELKSNKESSLNLIHESSSKKVSKRQIVNIIEEEVIFFKKIKNKNKNDSFRDINKFTETQSSKVIKKISKELNNSLSHIPSIYYSLLERTTY